MKSTNGKTRFLSVTFAILLAFVALGSLFVAVTQNLLVLAASAETVHYRVYSQENLKELYENANTYPVLEAMPIETIENAYNKETNRLDKYFDTYYKFSFNLTANKINEVSVLLPQITFLTHGLGGNASHWGISGDFTAQTPKITMGDDTLMELLAMKYQANIYIADFKQWNAFRLLQYNGYEFVQVENNKITDNSVHSIVVFSGYGTEESNDYIYAQFNIMASALISDLKELDPAHKLPRVNLIGHSRGGITNMQYALDHPDLVAEIYSLGTPYLGSTTATIDTTIRDLFGWGFSKSTGETDIVTKYPVYRDRWNAGYDKYYKDIKVHALGGYENLSMLLYEFLYNIIPDQSKEVAKAFINSFGMLLSMVSHYTFLDYEVVLKAFIGNLNYYIPNMGTHGTIADGIVSYIHAFWSEFVFDGVNTIWKDDCLVHLDSQLGISENASGSYSGFNRVSKLFDIYGNYDFSKLSAPDMPPVTHNLEAQDFEMLSYILNNIEASSLLRSSYIVKPVYSNSAEIVSYIKTSDVSEIEIPDRLYCEDNDGSNGKMRNVIAIGDNAFSNAMGSYDSLTSITIPSSVTKIGTRAFKNTNISSVTLPSGLQKIGDEAFYGCNELNGVTIGQNVNELGSNAFGGCNKLTNITVNSQNAKYTSENGVLYTKNKDKLVCYPSGKTATSFTVDTACLELSNYAFTNNASLQTLNLNNVNTINSYAVINCPVLATLNAPKTDFIYSAGVAATKLTDEAEDVVIGKVMYKKTSAGETVVVGDNIESISAYAFVGNDSVKKVVLGKNVESVCEYAFTGCSTLENIEALNLDKVVHLGMGALDGCSENIDIKVPSNNLGNYKTDAAKGWTEYADKITTKQVGVKYYVDGSLKETKTLAYGDNLGTVDNPQKAGYLFKGWRDGNGKAYDSLSVVDNADGLELFSEFEAVTYTITFQTGCDVFVQNMMFTVEEDTTLPTITREGYTFKGWHTSSDFTEANNMGTIIRKGSITNNVTLYAEWQANEYTITFVDSSGQNVENMTVTYGQPYTLPVLTKENYTFDGWRTEAGIYYSQISGASSFAVWNIAADTTLYASWTRITFKIKIDMDGRVYWVGGRDTISDTETDIEAGELGTVDDLSDRFNPRKISYKEGHKFKYFAKKGFEDKLLSWSELYGNTPVDGAIYEITAIFEKEFFQLIIDGVVSSEGVNPIEGYYDDTIVYSDRLYEAVSEIGKDFDYWAISRYPINANEDTKVKYPVNSKFAPEKIPDLTVGIEDNGAIYLKAVMKPKTYVMTLNSEYCVSSTTMTVEYGETVKLPVYVKEGAIFNGWKIGNTVFADSNGDMLSVWTYTENKLILADWTLIEYTITYPNADMPNNPTKFTIADLPIILQQATLRAARNDGWYYDEECENEKVERITSPGNVTLYAKWSYQCDIYYSLNGGSYTVSPTAYNAFSGDVITLPKATRTGYHDGHWRCNGVRYEFGASFKLPETATNTSTFTFTAYWTANTYTITFNFNGGWDGTNKATRTIQATYGEQVPNIVLPVNTGYRFTAYKDSHVHLYYAQSHDGSMQREIYRNTFDIEVYATWDIAYPELSIVGKVGSTWKIKVTNIGSTKITFDYNSKMLFEKDAKVWNVNDKDKKSVEIESEASKTVDISENWFATCIVFSVEVSNLRYVTYAYNLNTDGTFTLVHCIIR